MADFWFLLATVVFFVAAIGYTYGCDKLSGKRNGF